MSLWILKSCKAGPGLSANMANAQGYAAKLARMLILYTRTKRGGKEGWKIIRISYLTENVRSIQLISMQLIGLRLQHQFYSRQFW